MLSELGIEPSWRVDVHVVDEAQLGEREAVNDWPTHYKSATIVIKNTYITDRTEYVYVLVHEAIHLMLAGVHDFMTDYAPPKSLAYVARDVMESATSTLGNIMHGLFMSEHGEILDKMLR